MSCQRQKLRGKCGVGTQTLESMEHRAGGDMRMDGIIHGEEQCAKNKS